MDPLKEKVAVAGRSSKLGLSPPRKPLKATFALVVRHQTNDEQHRFRAATDALLMEMVRQQLGRRSP